jgi:hypothetical protein
VLPIRSFAASHEHEQRLHGAITGAWTPIRSLHRVARRRGVVQVLVPGSTLVLQYYALSQGTATHGCYCTVRGRTVGVVSLTGVDSRFPRTTPRPLYT